MHRLDEAALGRVAIELAASDTVAESVETIVAFAARTFETAHAGMTLIHGGGRRFDTVGPTTPEVRAADEWQEELGEGPCVEASVESHSVVSNRIATDPRWPRWGPKAAELGFRSVLSSELHGRDRRIGALNLYGVQEREFDREEMETAQAFAQHAGAALSAAERVEGLTTALGTRTTIGQAQGILMERYRVGPARSFAILKRHSQDENVKLAEVARAIVEAAVPRPEGPDRHRP